jgi:hypothetical protein
MMNIKKDIKSTRIGRDLDDGGVVRLEVPPSTGDGPGLIDALDDDETGRISRFPGAYRNGTLEFNREGDSTESRVCQTPGMIRRVMLEVERGDYDQKLVFKYLLKETPGSAEFNSKYIQIRAQLLEKAKDSVPWTVAAGAHVHMDSVESEPWKACRWEVNRLTDLLSLGGMGVAMVVFAQLASCVYAAGFFSTLIGWPAALMPGAFAMIYLGADCYVYLSRRGRPVFDWYAPGLVLAILGIVPCMAAMIGRALLHA